LDKIIEYKKLKELPFTDAITSLLSRPVLIDNIGELLAKLRIAAKLSQSDIAQRLGWQQSNLSRFESENYNSQTINKIVEYASLLGVWLHVQPSLTEEAEIKGKKKPEIKAQKLNLLDTVSTSISYSDDNIDDSLQTKSYFVTSEKQDVDSI
jgi:transcriptional regulator with XRE-family HTH domain